MSTSQIKCCKDCERRTPGLGCHDRCEVYKNEKKKMEELKEKINSEKRLKNDWMEFRMDSIKKSTRKKHPER